RGVGLAAAAAILVALGLFAEFGSMHGGSPVQQTMVADADIAPPAAAAAEADEVAEVSVDQPAADSAVAQDYASANSVLVHRPVISLAGFTPVEGTQVH
ncbi:MAG TPA: hypothetical protein VL992_17065, partial [Tepidisphaeraceae bacterium]|nr:hypothetical protein [Tepidisphaeraceae bacterium]